MNIELTVRDLSTRKKSLATPSVIISEQEGWR